MGKYDIHAKYPTEGRLSLNDLLNELEKEYKLYDDLLIYRDKFKNNDGSGIIDKLKSLLNFDIEAMAKESDNSKFEELKLLKELFIIEKYGKPKKNKRFMPKEGIRIKITNILAKPRMQNVSTYLSATNEYSSVFEELFDDIKCNVDDAEKRIDTIDRIDAQWQYIAQKQFDYVTSDMALSDTDSALKELVRINNKLDSIILELESQSGTEVMPAEGVMKSFFNLLLNHQQLCYLTDRINMKSFLAIPQKPDDKYVSLYRKYESQVIYVDKIHFLKKSLKAKERPAIVNDLFNLLSYSEEISESDYKHYNYALDHCKTVLLWLMKEKDGLDFSHEVPMSVFISVIQEIVYVKKNSNSFKVKNDYYGYNAAYTSLTSALKKQADDADAVLVDIWIRRIENRFCANFGVVDLIAEKNKAEIKTLIIKKHIFSCIDMNCLESQSASLLRKVAVAHINTSIAASKESYFRTALLYEIGKFEYSVERIEFHDDAENIYNVFRELLYTYGDDIDDELLKLAMHISHTTINVKASERDSLDPEKFMYCLSIRDIAGITQKWNISFYYDTEKRFVQTKISKKNKGEILNSISNSNVLL